MTPASNPDSWLLLCRTVRFGETDAAGVVGNSCSLILYASE